jgi:hypothetical protein
MRLSKWGSIDGKGKATIGGVVRFGSGEVRCFHATDRPIAATIPIGHELF